PRPCHHAAQLPRFEDDDRVQRDRISRVVRSWAEGTGRSSGPHGLNGWPGWSSGAARSRSERYSGRPRRREESRPAWPSGCTRVPVHGAAPRWSPNPRVSGQLADPRMGSLQGKLTADDINQLVNNPSARRFWDARSNNINVIQEVDG